MQPLLRNVAGSKNHCFMKIYFKYKITSSSYKKSLNCVGHNFHGRYIKKCDTSSFLFIPKGNFMFRYKLFNINMGKEDWHNGVISLNTETDDNF